MVPIRSRTRHAKRVFATVFATFVAAGAMAYSTGGSQHPHQDEAPHGANTQYASNGGGDTVVETQQTDGQGGGGGGTGGTGGTSGGGSGGPVLPGAGPTGGDPNPPGLPGGGPTSPGLSFPNPGGGTTDGGGKVCVVSLVTNCGQAPAESGPSPFTPGDGGGDQPGPGGDPGDPPGNTGAGGDVPGGVPEPASWLLMILGFGVLGTAVRGQRRKARGLAA